MYKVKLFGNANRDSIQHSINEWLQSNKDILIHSSNLTGSTDEYNFYILYSGPDEKGEELKEIAATVMQEQSIEVKDINPQIMEPSS